MNKSLAFSEVFRPSNPKQLIGEGQRQIAIALRDAVAEEKVIQEVLFTGPSGVGKTTIGRIYIQCILGEIPIDGNISTVNCSADTGIDYIREVIISRMSFLPFEPLKYQVYFLNEIHGLSKAAQNALLEEIEPLPPHVIMVATTTEPHKMISPLRSRFTEYRLSAPSTKELKLLARSIVKAASKNGSKFDLHPNTLNEIIAIANGNIREFVRMLQQVSNGTYTGVAEDEPTEDSLLHLILHSQTPNVGKWFKAAQAEVNYQASVAQMCHYAIKVLSGGKGRAAYRAGLIVKHFGEGLTGKTADKVDFCRRLWLLLEELDE